jgi:hypothetical protein
MLNVIGSKSKEDKESALSTIAKTLVLQVLKGLLKNGGKY